MFVCFNKTCLYRFCFYSYSTNDHVTWRSGNISARIASSNICYKQAQNLQNESWDEPKLQWRTNHPAHFAVGLSIFSRINKPETESILYFHTGYSANNEVLSSIHEDCTSSWSTLQKALIKKNKQTNDYRTQQFSFFHHNTTHREMYNSKIILILSDNCSSLLAANPLCGWAFELVGYANTLNEPTGSDNRQLSHKIMTVISASRWTSHIPVSMDATQQFTPLPCYLLWNSHWGWRNAWTSKR